MTIIRNGIAAAVLAVLPLGAHAADLPAYKAAPVATCWSGPFHGGYVGGQVDFNYYRADRDDQDQFLFGGGGHTATKGNVGGGIAAGWDIQCGKKVFGVIADWSWTGTTARSLAFPSTPGVADISINSQLRSYGTLRTRTGLAIDDILIYVTGGFAYARVNTDWKTVLVAPLLPLNETASFADNRWGWTGGIGIETYVFGRWTLKTEVLYMQFKEQQNSFVSPARAGTFRFAHDDSMWVARSGLSWRFGDNIVAAAN